MKLKSFIVTFGSFTLTTGLLYLFGHLFNIPSLMFDLDYTGNGEGFFLSVGSLVPLTIGLIVCFFAEKIYIYKFR